MPIDNTPIVCVHNRVGKTLTIACPHCGERHMHGAGSSRGPWYGHRLSHCTDARRRDNTGYYLIDLRGLMMTEDDVNNLFAEMNLVAADVLASATYIDDLQIEFRQLQRGQFPDLSKAQWLSLFRAWLATHRDKQRAERAAANARLDALWRKRNELIAARAALPLDQRAAADQELWALGQEIASLAPRQPTVPLGTWPGAT